MNIGKLRHRITLQRKVTKEEGNRDDFGGQDEDWESVCTVWAQISPVSGKEFFSQVRETVITHKIYIRYRPGVTPRLRVLFGTRVFRILSVMDWEERHEGMTLMCEESV